MAEDNRRGFFGRPTGSQERKLQRCSFATEIGTVFDGLESSATSGSSLNERSDTMALVISSPPEINKQEISPTEEGDTQENDRFLTPPENHIRSSTSCSSQEGQPTTVESDAFLLEKGRVENVVSSDLEQGNEKLGIFTGAEKRANHAEDHALEIGRELKLKRPSTSGSELDKSSLSKKTRVLDQSSELEMNDSEKLDAAADIHSDKGKNIEIYDGKKVDNRVSGNGQNNSRYVKLKKTSWPEMVNYLELLFGKEDEDDEDEDMNLLEVLKRRGVTFPKPA